MKKLESIRLRVLPQLSNMPIMLSLYIDVLVLILKPTQIKLKLESLKTECLALKAQHIYFINQCGIAMESSRMEFKINEKRSETISDCRIEIDKLNEIIKLCTIALDYDESNDSVALVSNVLNYQIRPKLQEIERELEECQKSI